jgi:hypothetical protein
MHVSANSPRIDPQQAQPGKGQTPPPRQGAGSFAAALEDAQAPGAAKPAGPGSAMPTAGMPGAPLNPTLGRVL